MARVLSALRIDIAALSETRLADEGKLEEVGGGFTFFWSGRSESEARQAGVGFAIRTELAKTLQTNPVGISDRIMTLRMKMDTEKELYTTLISAYAPTLTNPDDVKEHFYDDLRRVLTKVPPNDKLLLLGDFNARVGRNVDAWQHVIGHHGMGNVNSNGLLLLTLCSEFQLTITNALFQLSNQ